MGTMLNWTTLLATTWMSIANPSFADTLRLKNGCQISGTFEGGTSGIVRFRSNSGVQEYDILKVSAVLIDPNSIANIGLDQGRNSLEPGSFGPEQERFIREWFVGYANESTIPALTKRVNLPPALNRQLQRNGTLPTELQKRVQPLPIALEQQLPPLTGGMRRVVVAGNVILLEVTTARIVDLIRDVF